MSYEDLRCTGCQAPLDSASIDPERELASCSRSTQPGRVVRVVRDPVRGSLVVVESHGGSHHVLNRETCPAFTVNVERSNTNINYIWAMNGSVALECKELSGSVVFEGCH